MDEEDDNLILDGTERDDEVLIGSRPVGTLTFRNLAIAFRIAWNKRQRGKVSMEFCTVKSQPPNCLGFAP